jgi:hypothetical protein
MMNRAWARRHALTAGVEDGLVLACCMAMFLTQASDRSVLIGSSTSAQL